MCQPIQNNLPNGKRLPNKKKEKKKRSVISKTNYSTTKKVIM
jgi:hypothetical protein